MKYIAFDVETPNSFNNRMSAIGITVLEEGKITQEFYSLVDPEQELAPFNIALTGITPEMLGQSSNPVVEEGEELYMMVGELWNDPRNTDEADHLLIQNGYISVVAHNIDCTDYEQLDKIRPSSINKDF